MMFRNLTFYRLPEGFTLPADFDDLLGVEKLQPISSVELFTRGFVPPLADDPALSRRFQIDRVALIRLGTEERQLSATVIKQEVERRAKVIEERDGRRPGKKQREQIKDDVVAEFTKRAFVRSGAITGYIDLDLGMLVVDSASDRDAEKLITALREALTTFAVETVEPRENVRVVLSEWLSKGEGEDGFALGDEVTLEDPVEIKTTIKAKRHDLTSEEIRDHVRAGKQVSQMALVFDDRVGFTLDKRLRIRSLRFLDIVMEELEDGGGHAAGEFDARFTLLTLEVRRLVRGLNVAFGLF